MQRRPLNKVCQTLLNDILYLWDARPLIEQVRWGIANGEEIVAIIQIWGYRQIGIYLSIWVIKIYFSFLQVEYKLWYVFLQF